MDLHIAMAEEKDKDFVIFANHAIDEESYISSSKLKDNFQKDVACGKKAVCLLAKDGDKNIGMVLFSKVYWADRGEGVYLSQAYVEPNYRHLGVFKMLLKAVLNFYENTQFVTCLVAKKNKVMNSCMEKLSFEDENMVSYVKNADEIF